MSKFYVKAALPTGELYITPITDENVFSTCPCCDEEVPVNLMIMATSIVTGRDLVVVEDDDPDGDVILELSYSVQRL
ncbi:hypothetical protein AGMMS49992_11750 [Clostridia bacterium]|nr:hypothetical protein AGMMS49992_11750 [Clostridia bacterium]